MSLIAINPANLYSVRWGDTLSKIAIAADITVASIMAENPHIEDPDDIVVGDVLNLPFESSADDLNHRLIQNSPDLVTEYGVPLALAIREMETGVRECAGDDHNPRIIEYHATTSLQATRDEIAWCSSFMNWCQHNGGFEGTDSAAARSWMQWGVPVETPRRGDVVVFRRGNSSWQGHVGFFWGYTPGGSIETLGGNQRNSVCIRAYSADDLLGYRRAS